MKIETQLIHIGEEPNLKEGGSGDVVMPIHLASTFARQKVDEPTAGYEYSRSGNPTRDGLEKRLATLEGATYGLAFASGLAAETTLFLSLLKTGDHVIAFDDLYGGSRRLFSRIFHENFDVAISYVDARNPENVEAAINDNTRLIWMETPTNPLLKLCDIAAIAEIAKAHHLILVVDNTFMSAYFQNPLKLGADIVMHSTTKYMNGHSDSVGGCLMLSDDHLHEKLRFTQNAAGAILSPFDSFMILRGLKTLAVRMKQHEANALAIAHHLEAHPKVKRVIYPGLESHPQHDLAKKQMSGFGGMISFELNGGLAEANTFLENIRYFALAESLGGVESLIECPALMTHASVPKAAREQIGLSDSLIRISVGIEHVDDLIEDMDQALRQI
ncbi:MAG: PLP-dependent transferase [Gemmatimonadetes bacterium]|nr:MAG: PLP-dependent transferase [Gemmatimonadota bacterium]